MRRWVRQAARKRLFRRVMRELQTPLLRNGYALVANSFVTSGLGFVYWLLVARLFDATQVGMSGALISTVVTISAFAQFNLGGALTRFLPIVGIGAGQLIWISYAVVGLASLVASLGFVVVAPIVSPELADTLERTGLGHWLLVAAVCWSIFVVQDGVLTGLRIAPWVTLKNTVFGLAKMLLLVGLALSPSNADVFISWFAPALPILVLAHLVIAREARRLARDGPQDFVLEREVRSITRYVGPDYIGALGGLAASGLAPLVVLHQFGAEMNAVYFMCWTITYTLQLVSLSIGSSLVAEGALNQDSLRLLVTNAIKHTLVIVAAAVVVILVVAPLILRLFGAAYATEGADLLRLLALSSVPFAFTSVFLSVARIQGRMQLVMVSQLVLMVLVLGLGYVLSGLFGVNGMGAAWLLAETFVAITLGYALIGRRRQRGVAWTSP